MYELKASALSYREHSECTTLKHKILEKRALVFIAGHR